MTQKNNEPLSNGNSVKSEPTRTKDEAAMSLATSLRDGAQHLGSDAKHLASGIADQARKTAETQISRGQNVAADQLNSVATALRKTGTEMRNGEQGVLTEAVVGAADKVEWASDYLQSRTLGQVIGDVEGFARREPALFLGGAFLVGLLGGRFLKSSRPAAASAMSSNAQPMSFGTQVPRPSSMRTDATDTGSGYKSGSSDGAGGYKSSTDGADGSKSSSDGAAGSKSTSEGASGSKGTDGANGFKKEPGSS